MILSTAFYAAHLNEPLNPTNATLIPGRLSHVQPPVTLLLVQRGSRGLPQQPSRAQRQGRDQGRRGDHHQLYFVDSGDLWYHNTKCAAFLKRQNGV